MVQASSRFFQYQLDVVCDKENRKTSFGAIIRDDVREVIGSLRAGRNFHVYPYIAEAFAKT